MRYVRAAVILLAAMTFSASAFGQTNKTFHVIKNPALGTARAQSSLAPLSVPPSCQATVCDQIDRYTDTGIIEVTEYNYYPDGTCQFVDAGMWSSPSDIMPLSNGTPAGTVTFSVNQDTAPPNPLTGQTCIGGGPYQYARLHFTWNLHKNTTAIPRYGPTATFTSEWTGNLGNFEDDTFEISVPIVRPIGERSYWAGSVPGTALTLWQQSLVPPDDDPTFDFGGDCVGENVWDLINTCAGRPPGGGHSNFIVHRDSQYTDVIGARAIRSGIVACTVFSMQNMYFKSQAQLGYDPQPYTASPNIQQILETPGNIQASRKTAFSPNGLTPPIPVTTLLRIPGYHNGRCNQ